MHSTVASSLGLARMYRPRRIKPGEGLAKNDGRPSAGDGTKVVRRAATNTPDLCGLCRELLGVG